MTKHVSSEEYFGDVERRLSLVKSEMEEEGVDTAVKCVAVWIFQLLTSFEKLLFKATLPFTRFRAEDRLRFHPRFVNGLE